MLTEASAVTAIAPPESVAVLLVKSESWTVTDDSVATARAPPSCDAVLPLNCDLWMVTDDSVATVNAPPFGAVFPSKVQLLTFTVDKRGANGYCIKKWETHIAPPDRADVQSSKVEVATYELACTPRRAKAPPFPWLDERWKVVPEILTVAPLKARIEPPSAPAAQSEKVAPSMVATAPAPEIWRGPSAETLLVQATETCRIVTPVQPEAASHMIVLSVWRRIVLDADESPTMVREHGNAETARQSIKTVPDGQSASPVTWRMSSSYTRVSHAVVKPDAGQAITRDLTYTNRSAE